MAVQFDMSEFEEDKTDTTERSLEQCIQIAKATVVLEKIEYTPFTCENGHDVGIINPAENAKFAPLINNKCQNCSKVVKTQGYSNFIKCPKSCKDVWCINCLGCPQGHVLKFARQKLPGSMSIRSFRKCKKCTIDLTW